MPVPFGQNFRDWRPSFKLSGRLSSGSRTRIGPAASIGFNSGQDPGRDTRIYHRPSGPKSRRPLLTGIERVADRRTPRHWATKRSVEGPPLELKRNDDLEVARRIDCRRSATDEVGSGLTSNLRIVRRAVPRRLVAPGDFFHLVSRSGSNRLAARVEFGWVELCSKGRRRPEGAFAQ